MWRVRDESDGPVSTGTCQPGKCQLRHPGWETGQEAQQALLIPRTRNQNSTSKETLRLPALGGISSEHGTVAIVPISLICLV